MGSSTTDTSQVLEARAALLVTVGSDHHPFDRVITWVDNYLSTSGGGELHYVCQHGASHVPRFGHCHAFLEHNRLQQLLSEATAVVSHGGPGSLLESLRRGRIPIAVPRLRKLGEAVDDHQRAFCELLAERREIVLADTEKKLHWSLDEVFNEPDAFAAPPLHYDESRADTLDRFARMVGECRPRRRGRLLIKSRLPGP